MKQHWIKLAILLCGLSQSVITLGADPLPKASAMPVQQGQVIVQRLLTLCRQGAFAKAKLDLTQDSHAWLDRWAAHDVHAWLPSQLWVIDQQVRGDRQVLWLSPSPDFQHTVYTSKTPANKTPANKTRVADNSDHVLVVLQTEAGRLKVDIPESLRLKFGADWVDTVQVIENSYSLAVRQFGKENSQSLLEALLNAY